ncbi:MAG: dinucleotide-utilizing enzyme [Microbacterium sp.]|nr:MAG: dinucleotide-utilizing enzyme [Microbacterium sp.]
MTMSPRLTRSVPFWLLVAGSAGTLAGGVYLLIDRLGGMDARLTDGTATTNDVYVGQMWAVLGAVLVGVGAIGLALALTLGALRSLLQPRSEAVTPDVAHREDEELRAEEPLPDAPVRDGADAQDIVAEESDDPSERATLTR